MTITCYVIQCLYSAFHIVSMHYLFPEIKSLHCNELWNLEKDENIGRITSLVSWFSYDNDIDDVNNNDDDYDDWQR